MSDPRSDHYKTRGRNRPTRNALHPPRGARSAVACRALSGAPTRPPLGPAWRPVAGRVRSSGILGRAARAALSSLSPRRRPVLPLASQPPRRVPRLRHRCRYHGGPRHIGGPRSTPKSAQCSGSHPAFFPYVSRHTNQLLLQVCTMCRMDEEANSCDLSCCWGNGEQLALRCIFQHTCCTLRERVFSMLS